MEIEVYNRNRMIIMKQYELPYKLYSIDKIKKYLLQYRILKYKMTSLFKHNIYIDPHALNIEILIGIHGFRDYLPQFHSKYSLFVLHKYKKNIETILFFINFYSTDWNFSFFIVFFSLIFILFVT